MKAGDFLDNTDRQTTETTGLAGVQSLAWAFNLFPWFQAESEYKFMIIFFIIVKINVDLHQSNKVVIKA